MQPGSKIYKGKIDREEVERGILISLMGLKLYWSLHRKYGHARTWKAFSDSTAVLSGRGWRRRLFLFTRRWRLRLQRLARWVEEVAHANQAG